MHLPRYAENWFWPYVWDRLTRSHLAPPQRVWVAVMDHHEPFRATRDGNVAAARIAYWRRHWPEVAARQTDHRGRPAQYCFFYPQEDYRPEIIEPLAEIQRLGLGDVEIHIHHDRDTEASFLEKMETFLEQLEHNHGLLRRDATGRRFGFIHGNWALDNSFGGRWCGLNNELTLLARLGCYADFTMPCSPAPLQPHMVTQSYWPKDDPARPKSYDRGVPVRPGGAVAGDLMMITGPFGLRRGARLRPKVEIGELATHNPPTRERVRFWLRVAPRVGPHDAFIKLFTHGSSEEPAHMLLDGGLDRMFAGLREECTRLGAELRYVTAWEMYQAVEALRQPR